jgi:hypothetical protein
LPAQPDADAANTATFIAETDLPEWIRQIAAVDAVKQAEAERLAAEAARKANPETRKRVVLPGEESAPVQASNPWLNRREGSGASQEWSAPVAKTASAVEPVTVAGYEAAPIEQSAGFTTEETQGTGSAKPKRHLPGIGGRAFAGSSSRNRLYLLGVGILLLVLILLMM